jgi:hypothetical protein
VGGDVTRVVPGGGVPEEGEGLAGEAEGDGALDGGFEAVAGLADAEDLLCVFYGDFSRPPTVPLKMAPPRPVGR